MAQNDPMRSAVTVACVQAEPVILDRDATIEKLARLAPEAARNGARLLVFPEAFIPAYPSSVWARALAGWAQPGAKEAFALLARESVEVPGPAAERIGAAAREHVVWVVTGVTEVDPARRSTLYNTLLYHAMAVSGRGGPAILGPDGAYLAGPLYDEEQLLFADLEPARLWEERQRFDPAGHYHRPDLLRLQLDA